MKINIDSKLCDYIESLQYEKDRTNEIIAFMLSHNYDTNTDAFKQWDKDNQLSFVKYNEAKNELENMYITSNKEFKDKQVNWNLDFATKALFVEVVDAK